ncbi:MAG: hypothetical protein H7274_24050, partial [Rhodoferax sp.]|nr:hypothetical protein [Rhodoferax sp.]
PESSAACLASYNRVQSSLCALVLKPPTENTALNYWHPGSSPQEQGREARTTLQNVAQRFPVFGTLFIPQESALVQADTNAVDNLPRAAPPPPMAAPRAAAPVATPAAPVVSGPPLSPSAGASVPQSRAEAAAVPMLQSCLRDTGRSTLYVHIYDEASRLPATLLRQALNPDDDSPLMVAPIENVTRSADLRQQRRPVPWPQPTLVLHDPASRECARAIARYVGTPWLSATDADRVWLRDLPRSLQARPGVIELWLPPIDMATLENRP